MSRALQSHSTLVLQIVELQMHGTYNPSLKSISKKTMFNVLINLQDDVDDK